MPHKVYSVVDYVTMIICQESISMAYHLSAPTIHQDMWLCTNLVWKCSGLCWWWNASPCRCRSPQVAIRQEKVGVGFGHWTSPLDLCEVHWYCSSGAVCCYPEARWCWWTQGWIHKPGTPAHEDPAEAQPKACSGTVSLMENDNDQSVQKSVTGQHEDEVIGICFDQLYTVDF